MNKIKTWTDTIIGPCGFFFEDVIESLINEYHFENITDLYCINSANDIIRDYESKGSAENVQLFFAILWGRSKNIRLEEFLIGLGFNKFIVDKIKDSKYNALEKIRKVNYKELMNIGVKKEDAEEFVQQMIFLSDEIDSLLSNNLIGIWGG